MILSKAKSEMLLAKIRNGELMSGNDKLNLIFQLSLPSILAQMTNVMMFDSTNNQITYQEGIDPEQVPKNYFDTAVQLIQNKMNFSNLILYTNYYKLVFNAKNYVSPDEEPESEIALGYILLVALVLIFVIYQVIRRLAVKRKQAVSGTPEQAEESEQTPVG